MKKQEIRKKAKELKKEIVIFLKHIFKKVIPFLLILIIFVITLFIANAKIEELEAKLRAALQETENINITTVHVEEKLDKIGELATSSFEYTNYEKFTSTRELLGVEILGTSKTLEISYSGLIKVGYDIEDIKYEIDTEHKVIVFELPHPKVLDNYIIQDRTICEDHNNILNPISSEDLKKIFKDIEEKELLLAEKKGIYSKAEDKLKSIIENFFAEFKDYKIIFA